MISNKLKHLLTNRFDPSIDDISKIPDEPGNYIICMKSESAFPTTAIAPEFCLFDDLKVIYTGIAGKSLRKRDFKQHFKGNNAGASTLRKSLGVLMRYPFIPRDKNPRSKKTKFPIENEIQLTEWMCNNLIMYFYSHEDYKNLELELIKRLNPPLNIKDNKQIINLTFRKKLKEMRSTKAIDLCDTPKNKLTS